MIINLVFPFVDIRMAQHNRKKMSIWMLLCLLAIFQLCETDEGVCPRSSNDGRKPLYLVTLVSFTEGLRLLPGAHVAQTEINNRSDLLTGYRLELIVADIEGCSSSLAGLGLSNLVKYTVSPPCRPVVAVNGLGCSSHTSILSPVAGHNEYDLIQLSIANSPVFSTQNHKFPRLWRLLGSSSVYSEAVLAIMSWYNWQRIGILYDLQSTFYSENAKYLAKHIIDSGKGVNFTLGVPRSQLRDHHINSLISDIKSHRTTVIVTLMGSAQTAAILTRACDKEVIYPQYLWIHIEMILEYLNMSTLHKPLVGHLFLHTLTQLEPETRLESGMSFEIFQQRKANEIKRLFNESTHKTNIFANYLYDQLWAIALAVNSSLPILASRNLSIDDFTIGQNNVTNVIEEQLAKLNFQGAAGWVKFDQHRAVSTPVELFWTGSNGSQRRVGIYDPLNASNFHISINDSDVPRDTLPVTVHTLLISLEIAITFYIVSGAMIVFTTFELVLYLRYRNHMTIRATSPYLSVLMFVGFYCFYTAAVVKTTFGSFKLSDLAFRALASAHVFLLMNAVGFIFVTLNVKLVRLYRIFTSLMKKDLGKAWYDCSLFLVILMFMVLSNIAAGILIQQKPPTQVWYNVSVNVTTIEQHIKIESTSQYIIIGIVLVYVIVLLVLVFYYGIHNRKIRNKTFNDTRLVLLLLVILAMTVVLVGSMYFIYLLRMEEPVANTILIVCFIFAPSVCQFILFLPKIAYVFLEKHAPVGKLSSTPFYVYLVKAVH